MVESVSNFAAVDIDTVLFLEKGNRTLGQVFDVMGNVASPIYCVRFNSSKDIVDRKITIGLKVYAAPKTEYTNFIVLSDLMKQHGCDASWENDQEAPDGCTEFSDDEEERLARRNQNQRQRNRAQASESTNVIPNKVVVKNEHNTNKRRNHSNRREPTQFQNNYYQQQQQQQHQRFVQPQQYNYSWHNSLSQQHHANQQIPQMNYPNAFMPQTNVYPNPFAMQSSASAYNPFNLQAFPPLPPPMNSHPPYTKQYQKKSNF